MVKLWQLDRIEKEAPFCVRVIRACPLLGVTRCPRACAVALHSSLQHFAIGFSDSSLLYHSGNVLKEKLVCFYFLSYFIYYNGQKTLILMEGGGGGVKREE